MPFYEYHCDACKADFEHMTSISSRDKKVACPQCGSRKTERKVSSVAVGGPKSSGGGGGGGGCCGGSCRCRG